MAWNEIARIYSDEQSFEADLSIGSSGATGTAKIKFYTEIVIEHDWLYGCSAFKASHYLNIISVVSPIKIWIGSDSKLSNTLQIKNVSSTNSNTTKMQILPSGAIELTPGETYYNILLSCCDSTAGSYPFGVLHRFEDGKFPLSVSARFDLTLCDDVWSTGYSTVGEMTHRVEFDENEDLIPIQEKGAKAVTADNFTDESTSATVNYSVFNIGAKQTSYSTTYSLTQKLEYKSNTYRYLDYSNLAYETISIQVGLSLDGETLDVPYRDAPIDTGGGTYTFNLTEADLENLRMKTQGSDTVPIYYMFKTTRKVHYYENSNTTYNKYPNYTKVFYSKSQRNFTVVGCNPILNPTIKDIKEETIALTGDENTFIRYESMAEFAFNAEASKGATIVGYSVTCGSKTIEGLPYGVIDDVESGTFNFYVTDSRNMGAASAVFKNLVEYVKPTCYQKAEIEITGETGAVIKLKVNGNYFNGSFGAADNTLTLEVRHTNDDGEMGEWTEFNVTPTFNGNTYELEATFSNFNYGKAYTFQSRIIDKLNYVESAQYVVSMKPVFDWSDADFNFNVPVNIEADNLDMHGETVLRHNEAANNTVLSATGGNIYLRPGGTDDTYNQTILYGSGNVSFSGDVTFGGGANFGDVVEFSSISINNNTLADFVIETGSASMGSNGTWYWRKWKSGKAEAWGCRNYGNMAVTTTWGNLYRSAIFTQELPDGVFIRTPDSININIVHGGYGGWICKHEQTAPSADTTGSFIYVRPASATVTPSNLGFHIIGEWK